MKTSINACMNLGVMYDSSMSMSNHVSSICKSVRNQLQNLGLIHKYLTRQATEKLVHALISSRLDFCNSLFYQLPNTQLAHPPDVTKHCCTYCHPVLSKNPHHTHTENSTGSRFMIELCLRCCCSCFIPFMVLLHPII